MRRVAREGSRCCTPDVHPVAVRGAPLNPRVVALTPEVVDDHSRRRLPINGEQFGDLGLVGIEQRRSQPSLVAGRLCERQEPVDGGAAHDESLGDLGLGASLSMNYVERVQRTILEECWKLAFARYLIPRYTGVRNDLDRYLRYCNSGRAHNGRHTKGRIPGEIIGKGKIWSR